MVALRASALSLLLCTTGTSLPAFADEACMDFKWDVSKERALFAGAARPVESGTDIESAPLVEINHLYRLKLATHDKMAFAAPPGHELRGAAVHAGIVILKIPATGSYRIALSASAWIDAVTNQVAVKAKDFQGQHGCAAPQKIVEFELAKGRKIALQFSDAEPDAIAFTVTPSPPRLR